MSYVINIINKELNPKDIYKQSSLKIKNNFFVRMSFSHVNISKPFFELSFNTKHEPLSFNFYFF